MWTPDQIAQNIQSIQQQIASFSSDPNFMQYGYQSDGRSPQQVIDGLYATLDGWVSSGQQAGMSLSDMGVTDPRYVTPSINQNLNDINSMYQSQYNDGGSTTAPNAYGGMTGSTATDVTMDSGVSAPQGTYDPSAPSNYYSDGSSGYPANYGTGEGTVLPLPSAGSGGSQPPTSATSSSTLPGAGSSGATTTSSGGFGQDYGYGLVAPQPISGSGLPSGGGAGGGGGGSSSGTGTGTSGSGGGGFGSSGGGFSATVGPSTQDASVPVYAPTSGAYQQAGNTAISTLDQGMSQIQAAIQSGQIGNNAQLNAALQNLSSSTGVGLQQLSSAFNQAQSSLGQNYNQGASDLSGYLQQAINNYQPSAGGAGGDLAYLRRGVQRGFDEDFRNFQNSSAFQFPLQQAIGNVEQSAANAGKLFSGAAGKAIADRASDYTSQQYENFRNNRINQAQLPAALSQNALANQSSLYGSLGQSLANLRQNQGNTSSGLFGQYGTQALTANTNLGANLANTRTGFSGLNTQLQGSLADALGSYASTKADTQYNSILGRGTRSIEIKV